MFRMPFLRADGKTGPAGPAGPAGPRGAAGPAGPAGARGAAGPAGARGAAGAAGPAGARGAAGAAGPAGARGAAGAAGTAGARGAAGAAGTAGARGAAGAAGTAGARGAAGAAGTAGPAGVAGAAGTAGPAGVAGVVTSTPFKIMTGASEDVLSGDEKYNFPIQSINNPLPHDVYLFSDDNINLTQNSNISEYPLGKTCFYTIDNIIFIGTSNGELFYTTEQSMDTYTKIAQFNGPIKCLKGFKPDPYGSSTETLLIGGDFTKCDILEMVNVNSSIYCNNIAQIIVDGISDPFVVRPLVFTNIDNRTLEYTGFNDAVTCINITYMNYGIVNLSPMVYLGGRFTNIVNDVGLSSSRSYSRFAILDPILNIIHSINNIDGTGFDGNITKMSTTNTGPNDGVTNNSLICVIGDFTTISINNTTSFVSPYCSVIMLDDTYNFMEIYSVGLNNITSSQLSIASNCYPFLIAGSGLTIGNSFITLNSLEDPQPLEKAYGQSMPGTISSIARIRNEQLQTITIYMCIYDLDTNTSYIQTNTNTELELGTTEIIYIFNGYINSDIIFKPYNLIYFTYYDETIMRLMLYQKSLIRNTGNMCAILPPDRGIRTLDDTFYPDPNMVIKIQFGSNVNNSCIHLYYDGSMYRIISSTLNMSLNITQDVL